MNTKILIAEDNGLLGFDLTDRIHNFGFKQVLGPFKSGEEAVAFAEKTPPDVAILDIHLSGRMNGIELGRRLNEFRRVPLIYLTQDQDSSVLEESLGTGAIGFINKPFTNNELKMALHNAVSQLNGVVDFSKKQTQEEEVEVLNDRIYIRNGRGKYQVKIEDILWIQSGGGETSAIMTKEKRTSNEKVYPTIGHHLSRLEEKLSFDPFLVRCSRFHIVNLREVERIIDVSGKKGMRKAIIIDGEEIVVGDKYRKQVMDKLRVL